MPEPSRTEQREHARLGHAEAAGQERQRARDRRRRVDERRRPAGRCARPGSRARRPRTPGTRRTTKSSPARWRPPAAAARAGSPCGRENRRSGARTAAAPAAAPRSRIAAFATGSTDTTISPRDDQHRARDQEARIDVVAEDARPARAAAAPTRSVTRSAMTIGAVFAIGMRVRRAQQHRLDRLAQLARRDGQREPGQEHLQAVARAARPSRRPCAGSTASARSGRA